jgi:hypothetical protein
MSSMPNAGAPSLTGEFMSLALIDPEKRLRFKLMLVRGFGIAQRDDALNWVKKQEDRRPPHQSRRLTPQGPQHSRYSR